MIASILDSTKKVLGLAPDYTAFDEDVIMFINTALSGLHQLGIGPTDGFAIADSTATWDTFLGSDPLLNPAKTYVHLRARLLFDPPSPAYLVEAINNQIRELEWHLNAYREETQWVDPMIPIP